MAVVLNSWAIFHKVSPDCTSYVCQSGDIWQPTPKIVTLPLEGDCPSSESVRAGAGVGVGGTGVGVGREVGGAIGCAALVGDGDILVGSSAAGTIVGTTVTVAVGCGVFVWDATGSSACSSTAAMRGSHTGVRAGIGAIRKSIITLTREMSASTMIPRVERNRLRRIDHPPESACRCEAEK